MGNMIFIIVKDWKILIFQYIFPKDDASYEDMMDGMMDHIKSFFAENSTLMTSLDAARTNMTNIFTAALQNYSLMEALNKSIQEAILWRKGFKKWNFGFS